MKTLTTFFLSILVSMALHSQVVEDFVTDIAYLPEIVIKSSNTQAALDLYSVNILDYRVFGESILSLKQIKGEYFLGLEHMNLESENYPLAIKKPLSIYIDCFKNVHVLTNKQAFQVFISDKVEVVEVIDIASFNSIVKRCRGELRDNLVFDEISNHNQEYTVKTYSKTNNKSVVIYSITDSVMLKSMEKLALNTGRGSYRSWTRSIYSPFPPDHYQSLDHIYASNLSNVPVSRFSDFAINDYLSDNRMHSFKNHFRYVPNLSFSNERNPYSNKVDFFEKMRERYILSKKIKLNTFTVGDSIIIIDQLNSMISIYSEQGELIKANTLFFSDEIDEILQNPVDGSLYITSLNNQLYKIHRIDIATGKTIYAGGFKNISLTRTRKIYDGWLYYRVINNNYYKLYRTRLKA